MKTFLVLFLLLSSLFSPRALAQSELNQSTSTTTSDGTFYLKSDLDSNSPVPYPMDPSHGTAQLFQAAPNQFIVDDTSSTLNAWQSGAFSLETFSSESTIDPESGEGGGTIMNGPAEPIRNYAKYQNHSFEIVDTNELASFNTDLLNICTGFPPDTGTNPTLQILPYGPNAVVIKANRFDFSFETDRDFALLICDQLTTPLWKTIDFSNASDAQDGWLVQGTVPAWRVSDPMFLVVSNINRGYNAFFRAIPYGGPQIQLAGPEPFSTVSNTIAIQATILDLTGVTNVGFNVTIDGQPARFSLENSNTISLNTKYSPADWCNVYLRVSNKASVYDPTNAFADNPKLFFSTLSSLPLQFVNDTYLLWASDHAERAIGTNYFYFVTDKPQTITASVSSPVDGRVVANYGGFVPHAATISLEWNFTEADGITPYADDDYVVKFETSNPTQLTVTNTIEKSQVRAAAGCFITFQEENPSSLAGAYLNQQAHAAAELMRLLYVDIYRPDSFTQYNPGLVGTNRNHSYYIALSPTFPIWEDFMVPALTNLNKSDLTIAQAHGSGVTIGGGPYLKDKFYAFDLERWLNQPAGNKWRLRKAALWTCHSGLIDERTTGGGRYPTFPVATGMRETAIQVISFVEKNCGLFFEGELPQGGFGGSSLNRVTAEVADAFDFAWVVGEFPFPGGCDPTYSIRWAMEATRALHPEMDRGKPVLVGYPKLIYSAIYNDELFRLDDTHVKEGSF